MRAIELKIVESDGKPTLDYRLNIRTALCTPVGNNGVTYDEMAKVLPIIRKVDAADQILLLEEAEHEILVERIKQAKYPVADQVIFDMIEDIIHAPPHVLEAKAKA